MVRYKFYIVLYCIVINLKKTTDNDAKWLSMCETAELLAIALPIGKEWRTYSVLP